MSNEVAWRTAPGPAVTRARGCFYWDVRGAKVIDGNSGLQNVQIGHGRDEMADAAAAQIRELDYFPTYNGTHPPAEELADALHRRLPHCERFIFANSGSEAVETALKLVREHWVLRGEPERTVVVARRTSFHGVTLGALAATGTPLREPFGPLLLDALRISDPEQEAGETEADAVARLSRELVDAIERCGSRRILGVIAEPVQLMGVPVPPTGYWAELRSICRAFDLPLIADEIITGFGRTGRWFGLDHWGVQADVTVLGKGLVSGYAPISAVGVGAGICEVFDADPARIFHHISTTSGHPTACRLALENLRILEQEGLVGRAHEKGLLLRRLLREAFDDRPYVKEIRGIGMLNTLVLDERFAAQGAERTARNAALRRHCFEAGAYLRVDGQVWLIPPLVADEQIVGDLVASARRAADAWARERQLDRFGS